MLRIPLGVGLCVGCLMATTLPAAATWPVTFADEIHSSPMTADLDRDGIPEIVVLCTDGYLHVLTPAGEPAPGLWPLEISHPSWIADGQNWVAGSAALVDIDGDGEIEILQTGFDGVLHALDPRGQEEVGFPLAMGSYSVDTPTVCDLDGDRIAEIICRFDPNRIAVWSPQGVMQPGWPQSIANAPGGAIDVWSAAAVGDLDGDEDLEIIAGDYEGYAHAFHHDGSPVSGWPVDLNPSGGFPGWVLSSPACADLDGDGCDEVVIGCDDYRLYVLRGDGSDFIPGVWPRYIPFGFRSSPALADLDGDDDLEIVIGHRSDSGDLRLYAIHHTGEDVYGWPVVQPGGGGGYTFGWLSVVLADLESDRRPEIIAVKERAIGDPDRAELWGFSPAGIPHPAFPILLDGLVYGMPVICDLDDNGRPDLLVGDLANQLYRIELATAFHPEWGPQEWHGPQKDRGHTGRFHPATPSPVEEAGGRAARAAWIEAYPSLFRDEVVIRLSGAVLSARPPRFEIYDLHGRCLGRLPSGGARAARWDGRAADGRRVPGGIYFVRTADVREVLRIVRIVP